LEREEDVCEAAGLRVDDDSDGDVDIDKRKCAHDDDADNDDDMREDGGLGV
jgi:hypothetical protein